MTAREAKELLLLHSFAGSDLYHPKMENGFLGHLRPYRGKLNAENFREVMDAIRVLAPALDQVTVDREIVSAIWNICHLALAWGVHPDGMLRRNGLIASKDIVSLGEWVSCISYATLILLRIRARLT